MTEGRTVGRRSRSRTRIPEAAAMVLAVMAALCAGPAVAQTASGWTVSWENDTFVPRSLSSDESYTNGVRFALQRQWKWADSLGEWWRRNFFLARGGMDHDITAALVIGQNFFTPAVITEFEVDPLDRPFAGLLYVGARVETTENQPARADVFQFRMQHALEFDLGVLGPPALAGPTQSGVHLLRKSRIPKGWDQQLGTELAPAASALTQAKIGWHFLDVVPHIGALAGTVQTYAFGGLTARLGWNMTGFPALLIRQTAAPEAERPDWEIGVLAGVEGRAFARNAFVDGNLIGGEPGVPGEPLVGDLRFGFTGRLVDWRLSYTFVRRSREVENGGPADRYHNYGSLTFGYEPGRQTPEDREGSFLGTLVDGILAPAFRNVLIEAGIGGGVSRELPAAAGDRSREGISMRVSVNKGITEALFLGVELTGMAREGGRPVPPEERHLDTFFTNRLVTARFLPFGPRLGPGSFHVRAGVGKATAQVQSTLGVDHFYTREDSGRGWLLGTGYAFRLGDKASIGLDVAWNRLDVGSDAGPSARFLASTFTIQWHP